MGWQSTPYTMPLAVAAGIAATMFVLAATQRGKKGAATLVALFGAMTVYAGGYGLQLASTGEGWKLLFHALRFFGPTVVTLAFLVFALQYTGREAIVTRTNLAILGIIPASTMLLAWTDVYGYHDLVLGEATIRTVDGIERIFVEGGTWYFVHAGYSLTLTFAAIVLFVHHWLRSDGAASKRARLFAVSAVLPVTGSAVYVAGATSIDWGPVTYVISGLILVVAIFAY